MVPGGQRIIRLMRTLLWDVFVVRLICCLICRQRRNGSMHVELERQRDLIVGNNMGGQRITRLHVGQETALTTEVNTFGMVKVVIRRKPKSDVIWRILGGFMICMGMFLNCVATIGMVGWGQLLASIPGVLLRHHVGVFIVVDIGVMGMKLDLLIGIILICLNQELQTKLASVCSVRR